MKVLYKKTTNDLEHLTRLQKSCRLLAIIAAFAAVFVWFFKILFL